MVEWEDNSTFPRDDTERIPYNYIFLIAGLRISLHRHVNYPKDTWLCSCLQVRIDKHELTNKDTKKAQDEAVAVVRNKLRIFHTTYELFKQEIEVNKK